MESAAVSSEDKTCFSFHALYLRLKKGRKAERKTTKKCFLTILEILQNQVQIDYDNDNEDCYDGYGDNFYEFGDENYRTPEKVHGLLVKIYSFEARTITWFEKKRPKQLGRGQPPPPLNEQCPLEIIFFKRDVVL